MSLFFFLLHHCRREKGEVQGNAESDYDSEGENEDGDLTVYECPGLAPVSTISCLYVIICAVISEWNVVTYIGIVYT